MKPYPNSDDPCTYADHADGMDERPSASTAGVPPVLPPAGGPVLVTTWRRAPDRWRSVAVLERRHRRGLTLDGERFSVRSNALADVLRSLPNHVEVLYLLGPTPARFADWQTWARVELPEGYHQHGHYFGRTPVLRFRRDDGPALEILPGSAWFGSANPKGYEALAALRWLDEQIDREFRGAHLLVTPNATGRRLLLHTIPFGESWPCVPADLAELIQQTTGQGRIEFFEPERDQFDGVVELDGRLMYAHCARRLFVGPGMWSDAPASHRDFRRRSGDLSFLPGRYLVRFTVPREWQHIGLLGSWDLEIERWVYPTEPDTQWQTWADGCELLLAADNGWHFDVLESITFDQAEGRGPLDKWLRMLLRIEERATEWPGERDQQSAALAAKAIRLMIITTIGGLSQRQHEVEKSAPLERRGDIPIEFRPRPVEDRIYWAEPAPILHPEWSHPEWAAHVWARCRARMATFALEYRRADVLGIGLDALWINTSMPSSFAGSAPVGSLRRKSHITGPVPAAASLDHLRSMREGDDG